MASLQEALSTSLIRQPIFDRHRRVFGYELLYPDNIAVEQYQPLFEKKHATKRILEHFASHFVSGELCRLPAFITVSAIQILSEKTLPIEPDQVVLNIVAIDSLSDRLIEALSQFKDQGFGICLGVNDCPDADHSNADFVDYYRLDVSDLDAVAISQMRLGGDREKISFLACGVDDGSLYEACVASGFDLFQGAYYESAANTLETDRENFKTRALSVLGYVYAPEADISVVARKISFDDELTEQLLAIINSAAYGLIRKIDKLHDAIVFLGFEQVKRWVTLIVFSEAGEAPPEFLRTLLIRGRCCELYAMRQKLAAPDRFFTTGLFSGIDALLEEDLSFLIADLGLSGDIGEAIVSYEGEMGRLLQASIQFDHGRWEQISEDIDVALLSRCYSDSILWCEKITAAIR